jgi:LPS sulfotransferase NodH
MANGLRVKKYLSFIHQWRARLYPYLQNFALDLGLLESHKDYTRFIILGRYRSGSNYLRGLMNSHSQIVVLGELFQNEKTIGWAYPGYRQSRHVLNLFHDQPVKFLQTRVFRRFPREVQAVGFKIFYYHAQTDNWKPVWTYLIENETIKVIHIKRKNILKTHLSRKLAALTDTWVDTSGSKDSIRQVSLDYEECLQDFVRTREWEETHDQTFAKHPLVQVCYEDLARDYGSELNRIQEFLGVRIETLKPETFKQSNRPISDSISNYYALKQEFIGSPWELFFED